MDVDIKIPEKLIPILFQSKKKHKAIKGGRSSAKSESVARYLLIKSLGSKGNILCTRSVQNSIADSVIGLLSRLINDLELGGLFTVLKNEIKVNSTGNKFIFKGLNALADQKKQGAKGLNDIAFVWFEEASTATEPELEMLIPSIRGIKLADGTEVEPEIVYTYNSQDCPCAVSETIEPHSEADLCVIHYFDNPFLPETIKKEIEHLKRVAPDKYREIYLGEPRPTNSNQVIQQVWIDSAIKLFKKENDGQMVTALDPADADEEDNDGHDKHGCAVRKGLALMECYDWEDGDTGDATRKMVKDIIKGRRTHVVYDSVGVGAGVKSELNRLKGDLPELVKNIKTITPHSNGEKVKNKLKEYRIRGARTGVKNKDHFANFGAQQWFRLRELFENAYMVERGLWEGEHITINPDIPNLRALMIELKQVEYGLDGSMRIKINKKPKGAKSPNKADAVMMCFREPVRMLEPIV